MKVVKMAEDLPGKKRNNIQMRLLIVHDTSKFQQTVSNDRNAEDESSTSQSIKRVETTARKPKKKRKWAEQEVDDNTKERGIKEARRCLDLEYCTALSGYRKPATTGASARAVKRQGIDPGEWKYMVIRHTKRPVVR
jgi:hypothetical protein